MSGFDNGDAASVIRGAGARARFTAIARRPTGMFGLLLMALAAILSGYAAVHAVHASGLFELEGNIVDEPGDGLIAASP